MSLSHAFVIAGLSSLAIALTSPSLADQDHNARAKAFVAYYDANVRPLIVAALRADWNANVSGTAENFAKKQAAEEKLDLCLADPDRFAELKAIDEGKISDPILARQIAVMMLEFLPRQVEPELLKRTLEKSNAVERAFNVHRPKLDGKNLTDNDIRTILCESSDPAKRRAAWEAGKAVGPVVLDDLMALVRLRNEAARKLGFKNFYVMQLHCGELTPEQLLKLFDEIDAITREPFHRAKAEIDAALAKGQGIGVEDLRPWSYHDPFFQEVPAVLGELPDSVYKSLDTLAVCRSFYDGIGLPIDDVLRRSSLYEQPGKNPHAFCTDIDREGDIRILENVVPGHEWFATTIHELGHAAYSKNIGPKLPWVLRNDANALCTEGTAMMFERFAQNVDFLRAFGAKIDDPGRFRAAAARLQRNRVLIFARWCQVIVRFEMAMYDDPNQDLNRLWWDLVEKYQEVKRPEGRDAPDFAAKYHIAGMPAYYHNYMLGEVFASQVHHALVRAVLPGAKPQAAIYVGNKAAGQFMRERVFAPGLTMNWNELTRRATGEDLNPKAFSEDIRAAN